MFNDLIGLQYEWGAKPSDQAGKTDCFALSMEVRKRLGLADYYDTFAWAYKQYDTEEISLLQIVRWLWQNTEQLALPRPGAIFCLRSGGASAALATVCDDDRCLFIAPSKRVASAYWATVAAKRFYWVP